MTGRRWLSPRRLITACREWLLQRQLTTTPSHVAVIQDGNRRYARRRGEETTAGHQAGAETTEQILEWSESLGIEELTLYAFSTENFARPDEEVEAIFDLIARKLRDLADDDIIHEKEVGIRICGQRERLPERVQTAAKTAEARTTAYEALRVNIAVAYGGRQQLIECAQSIATEAAEGAVSPASVSVDELEARFRDGPARPVDLLIRSGGEYRTSNFLPWHASGHEAVFYVADSYWPAFSRLDFLRALRLYERQTEQCTDARQRAGTTEDELPTDRRSERASTPQQSADSTD